MQVDVKMCCWLVSDCRQFDIHTYMRLFVLQLMAGLSTELPKTLQA